MVGAALESGWETTNGVPNCVAVRSMWEWAAAVTRLLRGAGTSCLAVGE